jgi:hypothetical protein
MAIWRYPLKFAQGESLTYVFFGPDGPATSNPQLSGTFP